jgi:hypothetical protein
MHVNFIMKTTGEFYKNVLNSMIDPILFYLKNYSISNDCIENAINIHFFNEQKYYYEKLNIKGINVFMSHGIADKNWRNYERVKFFDYVCVSGKVLYGNAQAREVVKIFRKLCYGKSEPAHELFNKFFNRTKHTTEMTFYSELLTKAIASIKGEEEEKAIQTVFDFGGFSNSFEDESIDDFELISFLVVE